jgi:flagellar FliL protein
VRKMLPWIIVIILSIALIAGAAYILWTKFMSESVPEDPRIAAREQVEKVEEEKIPASELAEMTFAIDEIITNLADPTYIVSISLTFELDSIEAKDEFALLNYKIRNVINNTLSDMTPEQIRGSKGIDALSTILLNKSNELLKEGKLRQVFVTKLIVTQQ